MEAQRKITAEYSIDPITRGNLCLVEIPWHAGLTLDKALVGGGLTANYSDEVEIFLNGTRQAGPWSASRPLAVNDKIHIFATAAKGGTGRIIAQIAILVLAAVATYFCGPACGSAVMVAGGLLINAFMPIPPPPVPDDLTPAEQYKLASGQNRARIGKPMPVCIGKHRFALDLAARAYPSFENGESYFYGIYHAGLNPDAVITNLKVGDTLISEYSDVAVEYSDSAGALDLFPTNVDTLNVGQNINTLDQSVTQTTSINCTQIAIDIGFTAYYINNKGKLRNNSMDMEVEYRLTSGGGWLPLTGGNRNVNFASSGTTPVRQTISKQVAKAQYDVRIIRRTPSMAGSQKAVLDFTWSTLRTFQPDTGNYENQRRIAIKYKASSSLTGTLQQINAEISNKCITWNGSAWTLPVETSNPAWWFLHLARGLYNSAGTKLFGGGMPDSTIDLEGIKTWAAWCDAQGLSCNYIFTQQMTLADALQLVSRCGRASISFHNMGKLGVIFDDNAATPIWVCNPSNMIKDSFRINYLASKLVDGVKINFTDALMGWKDNYVQVNLNGANDPLALSTTRIPGVTNQAMAAKEANLILAESQYHLKTISFDMNVEGAILFKGAIIHVTAAVTTWADSGRLLSGSTTTSLNLSKGVTFKTGQDYILVRFPDGNMEIVTVQAGVDGDTTLTLTQSLTLNPADYNAEDIIWQFENDSSPGGLFKITDLTYSDGMKVASITAQDYDPAFYAAAAGGWQANTPNVPVYVATLSNINVYEEVTQSGETKVTILWDVSNGIGTELQIKHRPYSTNVVPLNYTNIGRLTSAQYVFATNEPEDFDLILNPVNVNGSLAKPVTFTGTVNASLGGGMPDVPNVSGLEIFGQGNNQEFTGKDCKFAWNKVALSTTQLAEELAHGIDEGNSDWTFKDFQVTVYTSSGMELRTEYVVDNGYIYSFEKNYEDTGGAPVRAFTAKVWVRGVQNQLSNVPAILVVNNPSPIAPTVSLTAGLDSYWIEATVSNEPDAAGFLMFGSVTQGFVPAAGNQIYDGASNMSSFKSAGGTQMYIKVAAYDTFGKGLSTLNYSAETTITPLSPIVSDVKEYRFDGLKLTADATTNKVSWSAGTGKQVQGSSSGTEWTINAGTSSAWSTGRMYLYVDTANQGNSVLDTTNLSTAVTGTIIATYTGGLGLQEGSDGGALLDGGLLYDQTVAGTTIIGGSITAQQMGANSITATNAALGNLTVNTAQLIDAAVDNAKIGQFIQSSNYNPTTKKGWKIDKTGTAIFEGITIYDSVGGIILASGSGLEWSKVQGAGTPANYADVTSANTAAAISGQGIFATAPKINSSNISTYISNLAVDTLQIKGDAVTVPIRAYTNIALVLPDGVWTNVQSAIMTSTGAPISIITSMYVTSSGINGYCFVRILRDGAVIWGGTDVRINNLALGAIVSPSIMDTTAGVGSWSYVLQVLRPFGLLESITVNYRSILLLETKK